MSSDHVEDPHWDLVLEIAAKMWVEGQYVTRLNPSPTQRFVDLQWAARQAGRVLGGRANVQVSSPRGPDSSPMGPADKTVTVTVTYVDPTGRGLRRAEEGLEELMRQAIANDHRR